MALIECRNMRIFLAIAYFSRSFAKAHVSVDITGCDPDEALHKVKDALTSAALPDACPSQV